MQKKINVLLIVAFSLLNFPSQSKEIHNDKEFTASSLEEVAKEMIHLNASLDSLTTTFLNLFPKRGLESSL